MDQLAKRRENHSQGNNLWLHSTVMRCRPHYSQQHRGELSNGAAHIFCQSVKHRGVMQKRQGITAIEGSTLCGTLTVTAAEQSLYCLSTTACKNVLVLAKKALALHHFETLKLYFVTLYIWGYISFLSISCEKHSCKSV